MNKKQHATVISQAIETAVAEGMTSSQLRDAVIYGVECAISDDEVQIEFIDDVLIPQLIAYGKERLCQ